ncbi:hypothetical protein GCM10027085_34210 [Spirosoma aerophilum]
MVTVACLPAFSQLVTSGVYAYKPASVLNSTNYEERLILEGTTRDYSHLLVQLITVPANKPSQPSQQIEEEALLFVKEGELTLTLGSKRTTLKPGSLVMIMPGDDFQVDNKNAQPLVYYQIRYTSNEMPDLDLYRLLGGSFWIDRQTLMATQQRTVNYGTLMSSRVAMNITTIEPDLTGPPPHTHRAAEIVIVLDKPVQATVGGQPIKASDGSIIFVDSETPHSISTNIQTGSTCFTFQF